MSKFTGRLMLGVICTVPLLIGMQKAVPPTAEEDYLIDSGQDPIGVLQSKIYQGKLSLSFEPNQGYLRSVLSALGVSPSSQMLVFSKTSLQTSYITGATPRAVYFNDRTYIGWIPGAPYIEIASVDPKRGPIFYTLRNKLQARPSFVRQNDECLQCHESPMTDRVPGVAIRSVYAGVDGVPRFASGSFLTSYKSPMAERWGGWYVTGQHGSQRHMGNEPARGPEDDSKIDVDKGANVMDIRPYMDVESYLRPTSDIVALMVAEHQMGVQNLITKAGRLTRNALRDEWIVHPDEAASGKHVLSTLERIDHAVEPLVQSLLCIDEPKLSSPISGSSPYSAEFTATAPKDRMGRSLSQLDLKDRLLKFRCSPMVYSAAFTGLPIEAKECALEKLALVLLGKSSDKVYRQISQEDRTAILEILGDTSPAFKQAMDQILSVAQLRMESLGIK